VPTHGTIGVGSSVAGRDDIALGISARVGVADGVCVPVCRSSHGDGEQRDICHVAHTGEGRSIA